MVHQFLELKLAVIEGLKIIFSQQIQVVVNVLQIFANVSGDSFDFLCRTSHFLLILMANLLLTHSQFAFNSFMPFGTPGCL